MLLSVISGLFVSLSWWAGGNRFGSGGFETGGNQLFERDLFRKPARPCRDPALTRANRPEKQPICPAAQLH
ncbi:hypothetical protein EN829_029285 [Mesorhizobium sp. M00.F.Ca.ET.186.01.1.1]|nr:hypothetical protein EN848_13150 [bacterium M00.F.Ca.ET.205.01.1.1]TGU47509.1 hypothetical protein EN795_29745 [bacterium M00.F.Ca.ET.152.01.1.1]TGV32210.1 hypothetical protein EN829_029285 [Mesorhizobium sp. M00.F.Ca.ET.186.01.1.1]TGZ39285.1 hypothetical protein EN805_29855 [bacterium M00.F.Ca.ET.162.01.1.1]